MKFWHLHNDWTLEVHESKINEECGRGPVAPECKIIGKAHPKDDVMLTMLVDAHNAVVSGEESLEWGVAFDAQNRPKGTDSDPAATPQ